LMVVVALCPPPLFFADTPAGASTNSAASASARPVAPRHAGSHAPGRRAAPVRRVSATGNKTFAPHPDHPPMVPPKFERASFGDRCPAQPPCRSTSDSSRRPTPYEPIVAFPTTPTAGHCPDEATDAEGTRRKRYREEQPPHESAVLGYCARIGCEKSSAKFLTFAIASSQSLDTGRWYPALPATFWRQRVATTKSKRPSRSSPARSMRITSSLRKKPSRRFIASLGK
jgi:hypothetical protein